jgi:hypothetical protein
LPLRSTGGELPCKASFSEKIALVQNADCGFLPDLRHDGEFYLSFPYIKNSIGRVALSKDYLLFRKRFDLSTAVDGRKDVLVSNLMSFSGAATSGILDPSQEFRMRRRQLRMMNG